MTIALLTDQRESPAVTFSEPSDGRSFSSMLADSASAVGHAIYKGGYGAILDVGTNPQAYRDIFNTAERSTMLTGNMASESVAREQAYDRRIQAVKDATGIELENPERGGYAIDARNAIRDEVRAGGIASIDAKGGIPEYQQRIFDQKLSQLQANNPSLNFGDIDTEARTLARGAADAAAKSAAADVNPVASLGASFAGSLWGSRRDPLFLGSMFLGPTSAVGRTALARIATSSLFSGLYNAGLSAVEQPAVQDWRAKIGMEHGVMPALHDVGLAFALGMIPGAVIQGVKEAVAAPLRRVLAGEPMPGDAAAVREGLASVAPREAAAMKVGEESAAADKATLEIPQAKDINPVLHDDMMAAALKRADDPAEPAPEAVAAVRSVEAMAPDSPPGNEIRQRVAKGEGDGVVHPVTPDVMGEEIKQRVAAANPKSEREAALAADEALDDIGRRTGMTDLRSRIAASNAERDATRTAVAEAPPAEAGARRNEPMAKVPWLDDEGRPKLLSQKAAAAIGDREDTFAMLVRSCN